MPRGVRRLDAGLQQPLTEARRRHRLQPQGLGLARQGHGRAAWPAVGEQGEPPELGDAQHGLAQIVPVDDVAPGGLGRDEHQDFLALLELQKRRRARAVEYEGFAFIRDIARD